MAMSNMTNKQFLLEQINDKTTRLLLPTVLYVSVLLILGVTGNSCVIFYYRFKAKYSPHSYFILVLAVFDFSLSVLCMPMEILELQFFVTADYVILCKMHRFANYLFSISSQLVLLSIAVERYRGICQPFKPKMTRKKAQIACVSCFLLGVLLSSPMLYFHNIARVNETYSVHCEVEVRYCTVPSENSFNILYWITNFGYLLGFVCLSSALITLYSLIGKHMFKQSQFRKQAQKGFRERTIDSPSCVSNGHIGDLNKRIPKEYVQDEDGNYTENPVSVLEMEFEEPRSYVQKSSYESSKKSYTQRIHNCGRTDNKMDACRQVTCESDKNYMNFEIQRIMEIRNKTGFTTSSRTSVLQSRKFTFSMLLVTAAFILSYVPFVCLVIWRLIKGNSILTTMSDTTLVFYVTGLRSYFINSAVNPVVFGACNNQFREFFVSALCKRCRKFH